MNRRESLALLVIAAAGQALPAVARASSRSVAIFDGRYPEACDFAADADLALDCRVDAAQLWYSFGRAAARDNQAVRGMTTSADALVIEDCASRAGLHFARVPHAGVAKSPLICWALTRALGRQQFA